MSRKGGKLAFFGHMEYTIFCKRLHARKFAAMFLAEDGQTIHDALHDYEHNTTVEAWEKR